MARHQRRGPRVRPPLGKPQQKAFCVRSLPVEQWPEADRQAWQTACRPASRLMRGGAASHLSAVVRDDLGRRYSYFLEFLLSTGRLDPTAEAGAHVVPVNVDAYLPRLKEGVSSVTVYGSIHKLRRAAQLIAPGNDYSWLVEIEKDLALVMNPRSKLDRLVLAEVLLEAGLTLFAEAEAATHLTKLRQARMARNGLMVALLALCPVRLKNFATLELSRSFVNVNGSWWLVLPAADTKGRRVDERQVPSFLKPAVDRYLEKYRPVIGRRRDLPAALWLSSLDGRPMSYAGMERVVTETTRSTLGMAISPHLFRVAAASSAAIHGGSTPHLASGVLQHTDPRVTEQHYNRATTLQAAETFARLIARLRH
jgi:integrase